MARTLRRHAAVAAGLAAEAAGRAAELDRRVPRALAQLGANRVARERVVDPQPAVAERALKRV